jgi:hypothetical protein
MGFSKLIRHVGACSIDKQTRTKIGQTLLHDSQARDAEGLLAVLSGYGGSADVSATHGKR